MGKENSNRESAGCIMLARFSEYKDREWIGDITASALTNRKNLNR